MDVFKLLVYCFAFLLFLSYVAMGLIPLPIAVGILVVMANLMYFSIDRSSPSKKKIKVAIYVANFLLIFFLGLTFIVHPIFEIIIRRM